MGKKLLERIALITLTTVSINVLQAQINIGSNKQPETFSSLEINTKGGVRFSQLTTSERDVLQVIGNELSKGLTIYNTDTKCIEYWNGINWVKLYDFVLKGTNGTTINNNNTVGLGGSLDKETTIALQNNNINFSSTGGHFSVANDLFFVNPSTKQIGIGTTNPNQSAILDLNATNKGFLIPRVAIKGTTDITTIPNPAIGLFVYNTVAALGGGVNGSAVYANKIYNWSGSKWNMLIDNDIIGKELTTLGVPRTAIFELESDINNFLNGQLAGGTQAILMTEVVNSVPEYLSFDTAKNELKFKPGIYNVSLAYEAVHNATGCTIASYFLDFPGGGRRIHGTSSFMPGNVSSHGGLISCMVKINTDTNWTIQLGRGQSGNCTGGGMKLIGKSTQLTITRMAN